MLYGIIYVTKHVALLSVTKPVKKNVLKNSVYEKLQKSGNTDVVYSFQRIEVVQVRQHTGGPFQIAAVFLESCIC